MPNFQEVQSEKDSFNFSGREEYLNTKFTPYKFGENEHKKLNIEKEQDD
jgi:hypothetical protein